MCIADHHYKMMSRCSEDVHLIKHFTVINISYYINNEQHLIISGHANVNIHECVIQIKRCIG